MSRASPTFKTLASVNPVPGLPEWGWGPPSHHTQHPPHHSQRWCAWATPCRCPLHFCLLSRGYVVFGGKSKRRIYWTRLFLAIWGEQWKTSLYCGKNKPKFASPLELFPTAHCLECVRMTDWHDIRPQPDFSESGFSKSCPWLLTQAPC